MFGYVRCLCVLGVCTSLAQSQMEVLSADTHIDFRLNVTCSNESLAVREMYPSCGPLVCGRVVVDGHFQLEDIVALRAIAEKGMGTREALGGPTILDLNTGFIRDGKGMVNLFMDRQGIFSAEEFTTYGRIIEELRQLVMRTFDTHDLHFTAPTFITRLDGRAGWEPEGEHDEYWHTHADLLSTPHYHYSGLLYLSSVSEFKGGRFHFVDVGDSSDGNETTAQLLEPLRGRVVMFTSGPENLHRVERVTEGQRFVLAFWFTCDARRRFEIFLDGQAHIAFGETVKARLELKKAQILAEKEKSAAEEL